MLSELTKKGILVKAGTGVLMHKEHWDRALNILREHLAANPQITLGEFRDLLGTSRKYAVMLLETYDQMKITKRRETPECPEESKMRKNEPTLIITFHTTADAIALEKACRETGRPGRMIPVPRELSAGCGLAWCTSPGITQKILKSFLGKKGSGVGSV